MLVLPAISQSALAAKSAGPNSSSEPGLRDTICGFEGNDDLYGLGVRLGVYFVSLAAIISESACQESAEGIGISNRFFRFAMLVTLFYLTVNEPAFESSEAIITMTFMRCSVACFPLVNNLGMIIMSQEAKEGGQHHGDNIIIVRQTKERHFMRLADWILDMGRNCFEAWFWFSGVTKLKTTSCTGYAFFASRVSIFGWFRTWKQVIAVHNLLVRIAETEILHFLLIGLAGLVSAIVAVPALLLYTWISPLVNNFRRIPASISRFLRSMAAKMSAVFRLFPLFYRPRGQSSSPFADVGLLDLARKGASFTYSGRPVHTPRWHTGPSSPDGPSRAVSTNVQPNIRRSSEATPPDSRDNPATAAQLSEHLSRDRTLLAQTRPADEQSQSTNHSATRQDFEVPSSPHLTPPWLFSKILGFSSRPHSSSKGFIFHKLIGVLVSCLIFCVWWTISCFGWTLCFGAYHTLCGCGSCHRYIDKFMKQTLRLVSRHGDQGFSSRHTRYILISWFFIRLCSFSLRIAAVELMIHWNHIQGIDTVMGSVGQFLPLLVGIGSFAAMLVQWKSNDAKRPLQVGAQRENTDEEDSGFDSRGYPSPAHTYVSSISMSYADSTLMRTASTLDTVNQSGPRSIRTASTLDIVSPSHTNHSEQRSPRQSLSD